MKIKTCPLCKQKINEKKDRWVHVEDFNKGNKEGEQDCHLDCWRNWDKLRVHSAMNTAIHSLNGMMPNLIKTVKENM